MSGPSPALVQALRKLLWPLVRLMLSRGITYPYLAELLKSLFVEVAAKEFRLGDKAATDSRISLVSGVHRKDVSRLRSLLQAEVPVAPSVVSLGSQLVARWMGVEQYLLPDGKPRALARLASNGGELSFEGLVASINSDIRSRVVLDEWLRLGVAHLDEDDCVRLNTQAFVPTRGADEKAFYLGHNLHDHGAAAVNNMLGGEPFLDRSVHYSGLTDASVERLKHFAQEVGMQALLSVNKTAMRAEEQERAPIGESDGQRQRMTFGVYFYAEPDVPAPIDGEVAQRRDSKGDRT